MRLLAVLTITMAISASANAADNCSALFSRERTTHVSVAPAKERRTYETGTLEQDAKRALRLGAQKLPRKVRQQIFDALYNEHTGYIRKKTEEGFFFQQEIAYRVNPLVRDFFKDFPQFKSGKHASYVSALVRVGIKPMVVMSSGIEADVFVDHSLSQPMKEDKKSALSSFMQKIRGFKEPIQTPRQHTQVRNVRETLDYVRRQAYLEKESFNEVALSELSRRTDVIESELGSKKFDEARLKNIELMQTDDMTLQLRKDIAILELDKAEILTQKFTKRDFELATLRYDEALSVIGAYTKAFKRQALELSENVGARIQNNGPRIDRSFEAFEEAANTLAERDQKTAKFANDLVQADKYSSSILDSYIALRNLALSKVDILPQSEQGAVRNQINQSTSKIVELSSKIDRSQDNLLNLTRVINSAIDNARFELMKINPNSSVNEIAQYHKELMVTARAITEAAHELRQL